MDDWAFVVFLVSLGWMAVCCHAANLYAKHGIVTQQTTLGTAAMQSAVQVLGLIAQVEGLKDRRPPREVDRAPERP